MLLNETRIPSRDRQPNINNNEKNLFLKRTTPRENQNQNDFHNMNDSRPIKISSQMVMNPNLIENERNPPFSESNRYQQRSNNNISNNNYNNNYYREEPLSQSYNVEAERRNRLRQERQSDYENPENTDPNTDYYYKYSRTSSDINDYNTRYTYNYRRDFDYIDFNKLSPNHQAEYNNTMNNNINNNMNNSMRYNNNNLRENNFRRFEKPFEGPTPASRQRSFEPKFRKKGSEMEPFYRYKNVEYYGQRDPITFGYDEVDDKYRYYSPFRSDYDGSRYGSYIYNYYLNAPMRGDISEDFRYPPQYYYRPKYTDIKPPKVFTNLI